MSAQPIPLRRFYVYVLKGADGEVFYVGRGSGGRMINHMAGSHNEAVNQRLNEAAAKNERVVAEILSWHSSVELAEIEERSFIRSAPRGSLANVSHVPSSVDPAFLDAVAQKAKYLREVECLRDAAIVIAARAGCTNADIAEVVGVTPGWVSTLVRRSGFVRPRGAPRRKQEEPKCR